MGDLIDFKDEALKRQEWDIWHATATKQLALREAEHQKWLADYRAYNKRIDRILTVAGSVALVLTVAYVVVKVIL
jgi:hypothetical protein